MFLHIHFFNSSFSAFLVLEGVLSWPGCSWVSSPSCVGQKQYWCCVISLRQRTRRGRSGDAGWLWCTDWEQREQLMIAYQKPRFTPSSCFWEWASSTAPQRRVWILDLTFSNLVKLDEKKTILCLWPSPNLSLKKNDCEGVPRWYDLKG